MRQWVGSALVQILACRLIYAKPLSEPMLGCCDLDSREQTSVKLLSKYKIFIHENASENIVGETVAILSEADDLKITIKPMPWVRYTAHCVQLHGTYIPCCV